MKDKILLFIIGVLVGAVISTGIFYIYTSTNSNECSNNYEMNREMHNGQPPEMGEEPPEKPNGNFGEDGQLPEKQDDNNSQNNNNQSNKK